MAPLSARVLVSCGAILAGFLTTGLADAETKAAYELRYEAAHRCPGDAAFRADVLAHVHDTSRSAGARVALRIEGRDGGFHGELTATDAEGHVGHRAVDGAKCSDVAHALAFLAGLAIELGGRIQSEDMPPTPEPPSPPPPPPAAPPRTASPPSPRPAPHRRTVAFSAALLGELRGGLGPAPRPALEAAFDLEDPRPELLAPSARLAVVGAQSELASAEGNARLRFLGGRLEGCPLRFGSRRIALRPCLGVEIGNVWARSEAPTNPRDGSQLWPSAEASLRLRWAISGGFFLESSLAVGASFLRPRYFFEPDRTLYAVPAVTGRGALGLGFRF